MSLDIFKELIKLSNATDKVIQEEENENPSVEEWFTFVKKKANDIYRKVQPTATVPDCLEFVRGSSTQKFCTRVSAVFAQQAKDHLHGRKTVKRKTRQDTKILNAKRSCIIPDTEVEVPTSSCDEKTCKATKKSELNRTFVKSSINKLSASLENYVNEMKEKSAGLCFTKQTSSKLLTAEDLTVCLSEALKVPDKDTKETSVKITSKENSLVDKEKMIDKDLKKSRVARQNKRKREEKIEPISKSDKNRVRTLSNKRKNAQAKIPEKETKTRSKKLGSSEIKKQGKTSCTTPLKKSILSKNKNPKLPLISLKGTQLVNKTSLSTKKVLFTPQKKNQKFNKKISKKNGSCALNTTYVSDTDKVVIKAEDTIGAKSSVCKNNASVQTDTPSVSALFKHSCTKDKQPSTPAVLKQAQLASIDLCLSDPSTEKKPSALSNSYVSIPNQASIQSYDVSEIKDSDDDDDDLDEETLSTKHIPLWATGVCLKNALLHQHYNPVNTDYIFGKEFPPVNLEEIFGVEKTKYHKRTSSAIWSSPSSFTEGTS